MFVNTFDVWIIFKGIGLYWGNVGIVLVMATRRSPVIQSGV
jgi:hypothetical protein